MQGEIIKIKGSLGDFKSDLFVLSGLYLLGYFKQLNALHYKVKKNKKEEYYESKQQN
jgi:hypothetical protein